MNTKNLLSKAIGKVRFITPKRCIKSLVPVRLSLLIGVLLSISGITGHQTQAQNCDADFSGSQIGSSTEALFIDSNSRGNFNKWYYGNSQTDTGTSLIIATHDYSSYGTYQVCHVVKDGSCRDSTCQQITLDCDSSANFNYNVQGQSVNFSSFNSSADSIIWDFGDGSKGSGNNPNHTYSSSGSYSVTLKVIRNRNPRCVATTQQQVNISCDTTTSFRHSINYLDVTFTAGTLAADSFIWKFGDGSKGYGASTSHKYASKGNYNVTLKVVRNSSAGCVATTQKQISVNQTKPCDANPRFSIRGNGYKRTFNGFPNQKSYSWNFGDGNTAAGKQVKHTYNKKDTFDVRLIVKEGPNCKDTNTRQVIIGNDNFLSGQVDLQKGQHNRTDSILTELYHYDSCKGVYNKIRSYTTLYVRDSGRYRFDELPAGKFYVKADPSRDSNLSSSYVATYHKKASKWSNADSIIMNGLGNTNYGNDITLLKSSNSNGSGKITGFTGGSKANCTNKKQPAGGALQNMPVLLLNEDREPVARTTTNQRGNYQFSSLALSTYYVRVDLPGYKAEAKEVTLSTQDTKKEVEFRVNGPQIKVEEQTTGIKNDAPDTKAKVYPNPATSQVNVEVSAIEAEQVTLTISNLNGQVKDQKVINGDNGNQTIQLNISQWPSGAYILKLQDQHGQVQAAQKLMVR